MCWKKMTKFCETNKNILNEGVEESKTNFNLIDESGEVVWIILDDNFNELISSTFTVVNAISEKLAVKV